MYKQNAEPTIAPHEFQAKLPAASLKPGSIQSCPDFPSNVQTVSSNLTGSEIPNDE
jgi:hypothetical protein